jgi:hypothetical protein
MRHRTVTLTAQNAFFRPKIRPARRMNDRLTHRRHATKVTTRMNPLENIGFGDSFPSDEEFLDWLKADPKHQEEWNRIMADVVAGKYPQLPPAAREAAANALAKNHEKDCLDHVQKKFAALTEVMRRSPGTMIAEERKAQCLVICDEITDALLDTPEPHRSTFLKRFIPIRDQIRAIRITD